MFSIHRMLLLALKKVRIAKITPPRHPVNKSSPAKFPISPRHWGENLQPHPSPLFGKSCLLHTHILQKQPPDVLQKFRKLTEKHLYQSFFFKSCRRQVFSREFCEIFKNTFFTGHFRTTASDFLPFIQLI